MDTLFPLEDVNSERALSTDVVWNGNRMHRLVIDNFSYKWCIFKQGHWELEINFGSDRIREDGKSYWCKFCDAEYRKAIKTFKEIKPVLLQAQNYECALCGKDLSKITNANHAVVDHNHDTGNIRGVLCHHCNNGLGRFKDDVDLMRKAIEYLEHYET